MGVCFRWREKGGSEKIYVPGNNFVQAWRFGRKKLVRPVKDKVLYEHLRASKEECIHGGEERPREQPSPASIDI